jgi:membrane-bound lytic murein transglycosylase B
VALAAALLAPLAAADYRQHPQAPAFIDEMVSKHGFTRAEVEAVLKDATYQQSVIDKISRPAEKVAPWHVYRKNFLGQERIQLGAEFWRQHAATLARVERDLGVDPAIVVAIIGVETRFGRNMGSYRVLDAIATLAFDYPKRPYFRQQLVEYLLLCREKGLAISAQKGSYAGAMGYGQFMPGSYRNYAIDFDGDGHVDILGNVTDAIGSVANYLKGHGWTKGAPVAVRASVRPPLPAGLVGELKPAASLADLRRQGVLPVPVKTQPALPDTARAALLRFDGEAGDEYWLGFDNFYAITRYNISQMYALAVVQLSEAIAATPR